MDIDQKLEQIRILTNIGHAQFHLKNFEMAYSNYTKAYFLDLNLFDDATRATTMDLRRYIGVTRSYQGRYDDALYIFEEILYSQKCVEWIDDVTVGKVLLDIGEIYLIGGSTHLSPNHQIKLAASSVKRALEIFDHRKFAKDHPFIKQAEELKKLICIRIWGKEMPDYLFENSWENI